MKPVNVATEREIDAGAHMLGLCILATIDLGIWAIVALLWWR